MMKSIAVAALAAAATLAAAQQAPEMAALPAGGPVKGASYVVDPTHTFVMYEMGHYGTTTNRGRFSTKDGTVKIDTTGKNGKIDITMDIGSINTGVDLLNRHVLSKDFFNVAEFPTGRFVADKIDFNGDKVAEVDGTLTLMGQTRPIKLKASRFGCYLSPLIKRQVCGGDFETIVERSDWGITWGINFGFENKVRLLVQVEAVNITDRPS
ncbi:Polyisoprenoid-binding protein YceI [Variovorax sp. CF079]|uniref:YceI family protein n=2 Tax=Variovorax TaxID=34072 RepID=UPI00088B9476|nr:YceI family protein [Variovorax sp. CF079]SDE37734.1 Polyisoprenoid-binding protein YceI [Variovorax sp. CF079]